jgi:hypothetical protein
MASASNVGSILQRLKAAEVDGSHRNAKEVGDEVLARDVRVAMEKIGGRVNRFCGCVRGSCIILTFLWPG